MDAFSQTTADAVLNDWDLAPPFASRASGPPSAPALPPPATPSPPSPPSTTFAAIDVLEYAFTGEAERPYHHQVKHLYRHDLEAFIWVFIWVACCVEDGRQLDPLPERFQDWVSGDVTRCQGAKLHFFFLGHKDAGPTPTWAAEGRLTDALRLYLIRVQDRQVKLELDLMDAAAPEEEDVPGGLEDVPEEEWKEFRQALRKAGEKHPALGHLVALAAD